MVTTGIGPRGREVVYMQNPHPRTLSPNIGRDDIPIDPVLLAMEREQFSPPAEPPMPLTPVNVGHPPPGVHVSDPLARHFGTNTTNTPASSQALADSDTPPPPTPSQPKRGPRVSHLSDEALDKAKASIQVVPKKRSFEESIIDVQMYVLSYSVFYYLEFTIFIGSKSSSLQSVLMLTATSKSASSCLKSWSWV